MTNHLRDEPSPYLQQHADNPVDWYPWGEAALGRARDEDRPILLSVGYAACHWCHVMAHESFENPDTAAFMNDHFVNVKVDREERPDLDTLYQAVCQLVTHQGGWPLTVFLTPDRRPFYVGTYFPPDSRYGRPGFPDLLASVADAWHTKRAKVEEVAANWTQALRAVQMRRGKGARHAVGAGADSVAAGASTALGEGGTVRNPLAPYREAVAHLLEDADHERGGFGGAPKFPAAPSLDLLLTFAGVGARGAETGEPSGATDADATPAAAQAFAVLTLRRMAAGGIHDQLGGGFHRYSVDASWQVPHFEKMLYDNALLVPLYLDALRISGDDAYGRVAEGTLRYLQREMTSPEGAFFCSTDADSDGEEGRYFVWTPEEVRGALAGDSPSGSRMADGSTDADLVCAHYGVAQEGNFEHGQTVLHEAVRAAELAARFDLEEAEVQRRLDRAAGVLLRARAHRTPPSRDEKVLTGWNGLAISAFAQGWQVLQDPTFLESAARAADFVVTRMRDGEGRLLRRYRDGRAGVRATLEDHAYLVAGLLDLYESTFEVRWLGEAVRLAREALLLYRDEETGTFYLTAAGEADLIARPAAATDNALPSPQSVMVRCLLRLFPFTGDEGMRDAALEVLAAHAEEAAQQPWGWASLASAALALGDGGTEITLAVPGSGAAGAGPAEAWGSGAAAGGTSAASAGGAGTEAWGSGAAAGGGDGRRHDMSSTASAGGAGTVAAGGGDDRRRDMSSTAEVDGWLRHIWRRHLPGRILTCVGPELGKYVVPGGDAPVSGDGGDAASGDIPALGDGDGAASGDVPAPFGTAEPPIWAGRTARSGRPTAYVCRDFACSPPLHEWSAIEAVLDGAQVAPVADPPGRGA